MNQMNLNKFLDHLNRGVTVTAGSEVHLFMIEISNEAMRLTAKLNNIYHTPGEIRALMEEITGKTIDASFAMFPPFYTDCRKKILR